MIAKIWALASCLLAPTFAHATDRSPICRDTQYQGVSYTQCEIPAQSDLRLFLRDPNDVHLGSFQRIGDLLSQSGQQLAFAMNAGMYHSDRSPVGLHIENGNVISPIVTAAGPGNFGMRPNGVFCITATGSFEIHESQSFAKANFECKYATQSGPMLVFNGELHPRFLADSTSRYIRNGVGVSADGRRSIFVISKSRVTFYEFASFFRDELKLPQALYFDGNISRLYAPELGRNDFGFAMGPVIGLVVPAQARE